MLFRTSARCSSGALFTACSASMATRYTLRARAAHPLSADPLHVALRAPQPRRGRRWDRSGRSDPRRRTPAGRARATSCPRGSGVKDGSPPSNRGETQVQDAARHQGAHLAASLEPQSTPRSRTQYSPGAVLEIERPVERDPPVVSVRRRPWSSHPKLRTARAAWPARRRTSQHARDLPSEPTAPAAPAEERITQRPLRRRAPRRSRRFDDGDSSVPRKANRSADRLSRVGGDGCDDNLDERIGGDEHGPASQPRTWTRSKNVGHSNTGGYGFRRCSNGRRSSTASTSSAGSRSRSSPPMRSSRLCAPVAADPASRRRAVSFRGTDESPSSNPSHLRGARRRNGLCDPFLCRRGRGGGLRRRSRAVLRSPATSWPRRAVRSFVGRPRPTADETTGGSRSTGRSISRTAPVSIRSTRRRLGSREAARCAPWWRAASCT